MELLYALELLRENSNFIEWSKKNPDSYLCHAFVMVEAKKEHEWQFGFTNKDHSITVFEVFSDKVDEKAPEEALKKEGEDILPLNDKKINSSLNEVLKIAEDLSREKYKVTQFFKVIVLVQNLNIGQVWNLTFVTNAFRILNVKIDTNSKQILEDKYVSLMQEM